MSCIHYKFKSSLDYDTITFEDLHVSLKDLRDAICRAKKIGQSNDHKLEIVNAQTKKSKRCFPSINVKCALIRV